MVNITQEITKKGPFPKPPPPPGGMFPMHPPMDGMLPGNEIRGPFPPADGPWPGTGPKPDILPPHPPAPPHPPFKPPVRDEFMDAMNIQNVAQMRNYIKMMLGAPVICIEISDQQLNFIIADTVKYMWKYYFREGNYRDYLVMDLVPGKSHYKICDELESIVDFQVSDWMGTINDLFTLPHNALYNTVMSMGSSFTGSCYSNAGGFGDVLGHWNAALVWLEQAKMDFGESYTVRYNEKEKELSVWPQPDHPVRGLMEVYKRQKSSKLFNDVIFRRMVVARAGMIWTNALRKYTLSISGGGSLNADSLYSSYKEEWDDCREQIRLESPLGFFEIA